MSHRVPLLTSHAGIRHYLRTESDGSQHIDSYFDSQEILDENVAMANHNDGWTADRIMRRGARIPWALILKWKQEEGIDVFKAMKGDNDHWNALKRKLNSNEFRKLRTAEWNI